jgi:peptidoglycan/xylan/chitin deacetylase (PgdA/CDA1 family)
MSFKHSLFAVGLGAIAATGADRHLRSVARGRGVILMFHHVRPWLPRAFAPNRVLEITPVFLDFVLTELREEGFEIVPLDAVPDRLRGEARTQPFAALTFDDGYRDNVEYAWPVLRRHRAPWAVFVTTDFADGTGRLWWIELEQAIAQSDRVTLTLNEERLDLPSRTPREKQAAFNTIHRRLLAGPKDCIDELLAALDSEAERGDDTLATSLCLGWPELDSLAGEPDVTIGAHTISHPMLAKLGSFVAMDEIGGGKAYLEQRLGRAVGHFAYPFGSPAVVGRREFGLARQAGFVTAVTTRPGHVFADHIAHLHALPRVSMNGLFQTQTALRALLSGVPFLAWRRGRVINVEA